MTEGDLARLEDTTDPIEWTQCSHMAEGIKASGHRTRGRLLCFVIP